MSITNRLCNPTPFLVEWNYNQGVFIKLEPDGYKDLNDVEMSNQFRPGLPGTESVREGMLQMGIFLRDMSVPYEIQAIEALNGIIKYYSSLYNDTVSNLRRKAAQIGLNSEEAIQQTLSTMGYLELAEKIEKLKKRLALYKSKVDKSTLDRPLHKQYDPRKTLLFMDPPKVFESEVAMAVFLDENPDVKRKHEAWLTQLSKAESKTPKKEEAING